MFHAGGRLPDETVLFFGRARIDPELDLGNFFGR
jgi:hypothetical protein